MILVSCKKRAVLQKTQVMRKNLNRVMEKQKIVLYQSNNIIFHIHGK